MKTVIWFIGSNCSGKTTQSRFLHERFGTAQKVIQEIEFENDKTYLTTFGKVAHVGSIKDNQCTGTDTLSTKQQIEYAYYTALQDSTIELIILDGIMATGQWSLFINIIPVNSIVILLDYNNIYENINRLAKRRAFKKGLNSEDIEFDDKTIENVERKIGNFRSLFNRVSEDFSLSLKFSAEHDPTIIHCSIVKQIQLITNEKNSLQRI